MIRNITNSTQYRQAGQFALKIEDRGKKFVVYQDVIKLLFKSKPNVFFAVKSNDSCTSPNRYYVP